jgi:hypothetical protein
MSRSGTGEVSRALHTWIFCALFRAREALVGVEAVTGCSCKLYGCAYSRLGHAACGP